MHASASFDSLIPAAKKAGFVATGLAAVITAKFGFALGEDIIAKLVLAGLLALCTFIVGYSLVFAWHAEDKRVKGAAVTLFAIAVAVEFLSHTGFTAANRDATIDQARHAQQIGQDKRATIASLDQRLAEQRSNRSAMKPQRSAATARADVATAEAHRWFKATDGCKETKGPQTRAFCDAFRSAQADIAMWDDISRVDAAILETEGQIEKARASSAATDIVHAAGASQGLILASIVSGDMTPDKATTFWAGVGISALLALFAISAGGLLNFVAFAFDGASAGVIPGGGGIGGSIVPRDTHNATAQNQQGTSLVPLIQREVHEIRERDPRVDPLDRTIGGAMAYLEQYRTRTA